MTVAGAGRGNAMHADRRELLTWSAGGAFMLAIAGHASAQTAAAPAARDGLPPWFDVNPNGHIKQRASMKHPYVENVVMLAELTVKPERREEFLDYTVENLKLSRSYPGNLAFDILINEAQPDKVIFYEVWESPKAQQAYMAWRVKAGDLTKLLSFLAGEPKFTALRSIAT
jgi:quinol monooxygenase YgiN